MDIKSFIQKYYKVVLAHIGAYGISWYLITYVFLGPLPVVSPAFKQQVKESPKTVVAVAKDVPVLLAEIASSIKERIPLPNGQSTTGTHTSGDSHIPSPWVLAIPTPMGGVEPTPPWRDDSRNIPTTVPTYPAPTSVWPTQAGPFPTTVGQRPTSVPAPTKRPQPTRVPTPTAIPETPASLSQKEQDTLSEFNARRAQVGAPPVRAVSTLAQAARVHATWMAAGSGLSRCGHDGEGGSTPFDRARAAGYRSRGGVGEIVACAYPTAKAAVDAWMQSPGHKAIMLDPSYTMVGVGWNGRMVVGVFGQ